MRGVSSGCGRRSVVSVALGFEWTVRWRGNGRASGVLRVWEWNFGGKVRACNASPRESKQIRAYPAGNRGPQQGSPVVRTQLQSGGRAAEPAGGTGGRGACGGCARSPGPARAGLGNLIWVDEPDGAPAKLAETFLNRRVKK